MATPSNLSRLLDLFAAVKKETGIEPILVLPPSEQERDPHPHYKKGKSLCVTSRSKIAALKVRDAVEERAESFGFRYVGSYTCGTCVINVW